MNKSHLGPFHAQSRLNILKCRKTQREQQEAITDIESFSYREAINVHSAWQKIQYTIKVKHAPAFCKILTKTTVNGTHMKVPNVYHWTALTQRSKNRYPKPLFFSEIISHHPPNNIFKIKTLHFISSNQHLLFSMNFFLSSGPDPEWNILSDHWVPLVEDSVSPCGTRMALVWASWLNSALRLTHCTHTVVMPCFCAWDGSSQLKGRTGEVDLYQWLPPVG